MANASLKNYFAPTPKFFRKIGIAVASLGNSLGLGSGIYGFLEKDPERGREVMMLAVVSCVLGWLGKEMTNFFKEEDEPSNG